MVRNGSIIMELKSPIVNLIFPVILRAVLLSGLTKTNSVSGLTPKERTELSKVFKYYYDSVRPDLAENFAQKNNISAFRLSTSVKIVSLTHLNKLSLVGDILLSVHYFDERLKMIDMGESTEISLPSGLHAWMPSIATTPSSQFRISTQMRPSNGAVTIRYRFQPGFVCPMRGWAFPFDKSRCQLSIELLDEDAYFDLTSTIVSMRDAQNIQLLIENDERLLRVEVGMDSDWTYYLLAVFGPSIMSVSVAIVAAFWQRRKIRVTIALAALFVTIILGFHSSKNSVTTSPNLLDIWLFFCFVHLIGLLVIDLWFQNKKASTQKSSQETLESGPVHRRRSQQATTVVRERQKFEGFRSQFIQMIPKNWQKISRSRSLFCLTISYLCFLFIFILFALFAT